MLKKFLLPVILVSAILIINACRFINLSGVPNGWHIDEQVAGVALTCLAQNGSDPLGNGYYPVFAENSFATPSPPTYIYPGMLWVKLFGFSPEAIRAFTVFSFIIALLGLMAIGWHWNGWRCGLWILLAGSVSPWTWVLTRVGWESLFILPYLVWGVFFGVKGKRIRDLVIAGILLSFAAYSYPPGRLQVPLLMVILICYGFYQLKWKWSHAAALGVSCAVTTIPLVILYLKNPALSARFNELSVTNPEFLKSIGNSGTIPELIPVIIRNFMSHLHPAYLLLKGSAGNLTLTTGQQGIMSWLDISAVFLGLIWIGIGIRNRKPAVSSATLSFFALILSAMVIGVLPAALVSIDNPHALRTIGAWPFAMLATGFILHKTTERWNWTAWPALALAVIFMCIFLRKYFIQYAKTSQGWFSIWTLEEAKQAKTDEDWMKFLYRYHPHMFTSRYYLMRYHNMDCVQARTTWEKLYPFFKKIADQAKPQEKQ